MSSPGPAAGLVTSGVLVGREHERRLIADLIAGLSRAEGASVLVSGEPAIGKTRLLRAAADEATSKGVTVAWGHNWSDVGAPALWPWVQVLRTIVTDLAGGEPVRAGPGAPHLAALMPELAPVLADRDDFGRVVEHADFYLRDAVVTVLLAVARRRPCVILLDDLQRSDAASLYLAEHLVKATRGTPLCLIAAQRDGTPKDERRSALIRLRTGCHQLVLDGLTPDQCRELARTRFGRSLPASQGQALFDRTGGNPLFLEEILHGGIGPRTAAAAPARSVLQERLEALGPAERDLVEIASVAGPMCSPELLARVAGTDPAALAAALASLVGTGLVQHRSDGTVCFRHELVAEAAAERLDPRRRARLHQVWAETLIEAWPRAGEHPALIAGHLLAALPNADPVEARRWAARAARAAAERFAHDDAAGWYEAALRTIAPGDCEEVERCDLVLAFGQALLQGPGTVRAMAAFEEAVVAAERAGDDERRLDALVWLSEARYRAPGINSDEVARVTLTEAIEASPHAPPALAARAAEQLARLETFRGTSERAHKVARRGLTAAQRTGDAKAVAAAQRALRWALVGPFPMDDKCHASRRLVGALGRRSHPAEWWAAHSWMLLDALEQGDRSSIDAALRSCRRLADQLREPFLGSLTNTWETTVALLEGRHDAAEQMIAAGLAAAEGFGLNTGGLHAQLGYLAWDRGQSASLIEMMRGVADAVPDRSALYRAILAGFYSEHGRVEEATFELERLAVDSFEHVPRDGDWLTALTWCARACTRLDRPDLAQSLRPRLLPFRDRGVVAGGLPYLFLGAVSYYTGALAVTACDPEAALDDLADALAFHERLQARPWVAYTLLEQGRAYQSRGAAGDAEQAATALVRAQREAGAIGMDALEERAARAAAGPPARLPTLARQGEGWQVAFTGPPFHLQDSKGLRGLHHLLGRPSVKVPAVELVTGVLGDPASDPERARVNVTRQIRSAVDRIGEHEPGLGAHLRSAVTTGRECCYRPAGAPPPWRLG